MLIIFCEILLGSNAVGLVRYVQSGLGLYLCCQEPRRLRCQKLGVAGCRTGWATFENDSRCAMSPAGVIVIAQ